MNAKTKPLFVRLEPKNKEWLEKVAKIKDRSLASLINQIVSNLREKDASKHK